MTARFPVRWANYPGDHRGAIDHRVGPTTLGEYLWVVTADYDADADTTRLGFSYVPPPALIAELTGRT